MLALLLSGTALAQAPTDWILDTVNPVLEPDPTEPWMANSVGAPAVAFDTRHNRFLMVFETRILDPIDGAAVGCPQGVWGLGGAESTDGVNWTVLPDPLVEPVPGSGTYWECVAAHPTVLFETPPGNGGLAIWFKTEQGEDALATCDTPQEPSWGCQQYTGIGLLRVTFNGPGRIVGNPTVTATPSIPATTFPSVGYPKVFRKAGTYRMLVSLYPDIWTATSPTREGWGPATPLIEVADYLGAISWVRDEFFNPTSICTDTVTFPLASFLGGRATTPAGVVESGGWGKAISTTGASWLLGVDAQQEWVGDDEFRHWDILRLVTGEYLIWFSQSDPGTSPKVNRIYFGGTTATFNNTDVQSKVCP